MAGTSTPPATKPALENVQERFASSLLENGAVARDLGVGRGARADDEAW